MKSRLLLALGGLCVLSIALLYGRLYFAPRELYSTTPIYRAQALTFLRGRISLAVEFPCAENEMILYKGRFYYYFGVLPALAHVVFLLASQSLLGVRRALPETVVAFVFVCGFAGAIFWVFSRKVLALGHGQALAGAAGCAATLAVCATSIFFDVARYRLHVYEEAVLYSTTLGTTAVLFAYVYLLNWWRNQPRRTAAALVSSICCTGAMLCRPNYATLPLWLAPLMIVPHLRPSHPLYRFLGGEAVARPGAGWGQGDAFKRGLLFLAAPMAGIVFLLAYNYVRFDNPTEFGTRYLLRMEPEEVRTISFGSSIKQIPLSARLIDTVQAYLTGYGNPLFFPHRSPLQGRTKEESFTMQEPFTFQRVGWILFPLTAAFWWLFYRLIRRLRDPLSRADLLFLFVGVVLVGQHFWLVNNFPSHVYRYTLDMLPGLVVLALAGFGLDRSRAPVTLLLAIAFLADGPHYLRAWVHERNHFLEFSPDPLPTQKSGPECPFTAIPEAISCGPGAEILSPWAHVGWDASVGCNMASTLFLVFSADGPHDRWQLEMQTDERAVRAAEHPRIFVQGHYFPLKPQRAPQTGFVAEFSLPTDAVAAKALPVVIDLHPDQPNQPHHGKLYSVRLAAVP